jgi:hypothetical protein
MGGAGLRCRVPGSVRHQPDRGSENPCRLAPRQWAAAAGPRSRASSDLRPRCGNEENDHLAGPPKNRAQSTAEAKNGRVVVWSVQKQVDEQTGGDQAERDAVSTVSEGEILALAAGSRADVGQTVAGFPEGAGPNAGRYQLDRRKESPKPLDELPDSFLEQRVLLMVVCIPCIPAADQGPSVARFPSVKVGAGGFPNQTVIRPACR